MNVNRIAHDPSRPLRGHLPSRSEGRDMNSSTMLSEPR